MLKEYISDSADETFDIGKTFSGCLKCGDVIALSGDLGAGKTVFVKGIAKGLNIGELITSPTFNIVRVGLGNVLHFLTVHGGGGQPDLFLERFKSHAL